MRNDVAVALSREEWRLVSSLREIPESRVRDGLTAVIEDLVEFVREPHCPKMQADGVPCASAHESCEECRQVAALLGALHVRLRGV